MRIFRNGKTILAVGVIALLACCLMFRAAPLLAYGTPGEFAEQTGGASGLGELETNLPTIIGGMIGAVLGFVGVILLGLMIYGGFLWMTAAGNEERVGKAKKILVGSIIGAVLVVLAYAISLFVIDIVAPSGPEGVETAGEEEFVETEDALEESLTPEDIGSMLDEAGIGGAGTDEELLE